MDFHCDHPELVMPDGTEINIAKDRKLSSILSELGADSWEMIGTGARGRGTRHLLYFKRELNVITGTESVKSS